MQDDAGKEVLEKTTEETYSNAIRYAGEFYDAESGLIYLRARYYNPYTGRFISEDSYWGEDNRPLSLNRYTYVLNSPLMFWDPTGHWEAGDENLNVYAQIKIIELTNNYYNATTEEDRQRIQAEANGIRNNPSSSEPVHSIIKIPTGAIEEANRLGDETRGWLLTILEKQYRE
ncbi:hypothetical protein DQG13_08950 [Paenibacillus sp. YN15]|nr:hypothetical protein DQG13_08950 [Paenibacillus sp. YN15]